MVAVFIDFIDWLLGRKERREERDAYLAAIRAVADASTAQSEMFQAWLDSFKSQTDANAKGWTVTDRDQYLDELSREKPELFVGMPPDLRNDPSAMEEWLGQEIMNL